MQDLARAVPVRQVGRNDLDTRKRRLERRHGIAKKGGATRDVYGELAELGLTGIAVSDAHGGMGFGAIEAMVVMEELGRGLVNAPYAAGALVAPTVLA